MTPLDMRRDKARELSTQGLSIRAIAKRLRVSKSTVSNLLKPSNGVSNGVSKPTDVQPSKMDKLEASLARMVGLLELAAPEIEGLEIVRDELLATCEAQRQQLDQMRELDGAVAPYREKIKQMGFTEAQAVDQLFKWQMALSGPDKIRAFKALMENHGVDPAEVSPPPQPAPVQVEPLQAAPQLVIEPQVRAMLHPALAALVAPSSEAGRIAELEHEIASVKRQQRVGNAKRAGSSMRSSTPNHAPVPPYENGYTSRNTDTARESIMKAIAEQRAKTRIGTGYA